MKKTFLLVLLGLLGLRGLVAQTKFGVIVQPQVSWLKDDVVLTSGEGSRMGIGFGLNADLALPLGENYFFSTGVFMVNGGGKLSYASSVDTATQFPFIHSSETDSFPLGTVVSYKLQYLQIPLGLKFKTAAFGDFHFFADLGLDLLFRLKAFGDIESAAIEDVSIKEEVMPLGLGYHLGTGVEYDIKGSTAAMLGIHFFNGFTDYTTQKAERHEDKVVFNYVALQLGILF